MNTFSALGQDAIAAELEYRRRVISVSTPRRLRRSRRAAR
jgi:hypothetical protein